MIVRHSPGEMASRWLKFVFSPRGRTTRLHYALGWFTNFASYVVLLLPVELVLVAMGFGSVADHPRGPRAWLLYSVMTYSTFALVTRRLRDSGWSTRHAYWIMGGYLVAANPYTIERDSHDPVVGLAALICCVGCLTLLFLPSASTRKAVRDVETDMPPVGR